VIVLSISSQKGGVGKTTVALNLSYALARRGWKTLIVDADPQGAIGLSLSRKTRRLPGTNEVLRGQVLLEKVMLDTRQECLSVLPAGKFRPLDASLASNTLYTKENIARLLRQAAEMDFEVVLIDTPAGFFGPTVGFLAQSNFVLVPQQAEPLAIRSTPQILEMLSELRKQGVAPKLVGFVLTMVQKDVEESIGVHEEVRNTIPAHLMIEASIPRDPVFLKASGKGIPLALLYKNPPKSSLVFDQIAEEFEQRAKMGRKEHERGEKQILLD
jgi:chromosome partitioning protein